MALIEDFDKLAHEHLENSKPVKGVSEDSIEVLSKINGDEIIIDMDDDIIGDVIDISNTYLDGIMEPEPPYPDYMDGDLPGMIDIDDEPLDIDTEDNRSSGYQGENEVLS